MPKDKSNIEKAIGKLISSIQKEWGSEAGLPESEDSFEVMGFAHDLLQAKTSENINKILNNKNINEYLGSSWVNSHPSVSPAIQMLELTLSKNNHISLDVKYEIYDKKTTYWGSILFNHIHEDNEQLYLSGKIRPSEYFSPIGKLFDEHSRLMGISGDCEDKNVSKTALRISELGVKLINTTNKKEHYIGTVFVNEEGMLTCTVKNYNT